MALSARKPQVAQKPTPQKATWAELPGWGTPLFPRESIDFLQIVLDDPALEHEWLVTASQQVDDFPRKKEVLNPTTTDGYVWDIGFVYVLPIGGEAIVLIPRKDTAQQSSRHCAVYARNVAMTDYIPEITRLVQNLAHSIED